MNENQSETLTIFNSVIKPENINAYATNTINALIAECTPLDCEFLASSPEFYVFCEKFKDLLKSNDVKKDLLFPTNESFETSHNHISIEIGIPYTQNSFLLHIFEKVILVYFLSQNVCKTFLAALNTSTLAISSRKTEHQRSVVVWEKSRLPIREYDSYSPVKDAKILFSQWTRTNADGQRSFAGGLKPENNPLVFTLQYGVLEICFGSTTYNIEFSRSKETFEVASAFNSLAITELTDSNADEKSTIYNSAFNIVKESFVKESFVKAIDNSSSSKKPYIILIIILAAILLGIPLLAFVITAIEWILLYYAVYH